MAKNNNKNNAPKKIDTPKVEPQPQPKAAVISTSDVFDTREVGWLNFFRKTWLGALIVGLVSFVVYTNTISHDYAVDDAIVITRNQFTRLGMKGMHGIWTEDTFVGFFGKQQNLVSGGRYRPLSVATFAIEVALLGDHPKNPTTGDYVKDKDGDFVKDKDGNYLYDLMPNVSHTFNIVLYSLLCVLIYFAILQLMRSKLADSKSVKTDVLHDDESEEQDGLTPKKAALAGFIAFATAILYATHPIHTEAIANIKGRDEILVMLGSVMAMHYAFKAAISTNTTKTVISWVLALLGFAIGIFSKESAIPFLAVIPAAIYIFAPKISLGRSLLYTLPFFLFTIIFWFGIRAQVLKVQNPDDPMAKILDQLSKDMYKNHKTAFFWIKDEPTELMNNPFLKLENNRYQPYNDSERLGSILYTWADYLRLLVVPHPLTNDYYPFHISVKKKNPEKVETFRNFEIPTMSHGVPMLSLILHLGLGILGLFLAYRRNAFGFCILFYFATFSVVSNFFFPIGTNMAERFMFMPSLAFSFACGMGLAAMAQRQKLEPFVLPLLAVVVVMYSAKTFMRNFAWKNDYVLFTTDIANSPNSAKLNNAVSGVLQDHLHTNPSLTAQEREDILHRALKHSTNAISMHPTYNNAWLLYGNSNTMLANVYLEKIGKTESVEIKIYGNTKVLAPLDAALAHYDEGIKAYLEVMRLRPDHPDAPTNLGVAYRDKGKVMGEKMNKIVDALALFQSAQKLLPNDAETLRLLGIAYGMTQQHELAIASLERACQIFPGQAANWYNLGIAYAAIGNAEKAKQCTDQAAQIDPNYTQKVSGQ
jgi:protein O-mannosyl-transferase